MSETDRPTAPTSGLSGRRDFLGFAVMGVALTTAYGTLAAFFARFLYPARPRAKQFVYVSGIDRLRQGDSLTWRTPAGQTVAVARIGEGESTDAFIALSSTCPHLGCQVHWEAANQRFFCPCHNGVFDPSGKATAGPPADAGQSLPRYQLKVAGGLLYIELPVAEAALGPGAIVETRAAAPCSLQRLCRDLKARG